MKTKTYSDKSFVTLEQRVCMVCGKQYDTGSLLLDKRMRERFERYTVTGMGLCPDDKAKFDDGYLALVEIDPEKTPLHGDRIKPEDAYRTGTVVHIRRTVAKRLFNVPVPDDLPMMFTGPDVVALLQSMMPTEEEEDGK